MVRVELSQIRIDEKRHEQVIVLKERNGTRSFPIVIGIQEANAIKIEIAGVNPPRPLTHDLLVDTIKQLGATLEKVVVDKLKDNIFFAKLMLKNRDGEETGVDARPSDSIAIAVRAKVPLFVSEEVLDKVAT